MMSQVVQAVLLYAFLSERSSQYPAGRLDMFMLCSKAYSCRLVHTLPGRTPTRAHHNVPTPYQAHTLAGQHRTRPTPRERSCARHRTVGWSTHLAGRQCAWQSTALIPVLGTGRTARMHDHQKVLAESAAGREAETGMSTSVRKPGRDAPMAGTVWLAVCGRHCVAGCVWLTLCGWLCVAGTVCGWLCVAGTVWLALCR
eukprot:364480-Chlamydomonas_euryale.AAC.14